MIRKELQPFAHQVHYQNAFHFAIYQGAHAELEQVVGGLAPGRRYWYSDVDTGAAPDFRVPDFDSPRLSINWGTPLDE